jgi:surface antigen
MLRRTTVLAAAAFISLSTQAFAADSVPDVTPTAAASALSPGGWSLDSLKLKVLSLTKNWQCVTFARAFSGLQIFGDAWTWWASAAGKYERGQQPEAGSVLVFQRHGSMSRGHVAVVSQVLTDRVVQLTHANWSPINGRRGQVEEEVTAVDVSPRGDWSKVKVWYGPLKDLGTTAYPTYGFIYQPKNGGGVDLAASLQKASFGGPADAAR